jgi:CDP-paratose 2-epimerase
VRAFGYVAQRPRPGAVYNIGGGRGTDCSVIEAIELCETICGAPVTRRLETTRRIGDHIWWISDNSLFRQDYPDWRPSYDIAAILREIHGERSRFN